MLGLEASPPKGRSDGFQDDDFEGSEEVAPQQSTVCQEVEGSEEAAPEQYI